MEHYRTIRVTHTTPTGDVVDEHQLLSRREDPNDTEHDLPVEPTLLLRVTDGGERVVEYSVADVVAIDLD